MKIKYHDPRLPDGYEIALTGLNGLLINNQEVDIDDDEVVMYEKKTGKDLKEIVKYNTKFGGKPKRTTKAKTNTEDNTTEAASESEATE